MYVLNAEGETSLESTDGVMDAEGEISFESAKGAMALESADADFSLAVQGNSTREGIME